MSNIGVSLRTTNVTGVLGNTAAMLSALLASSLYAPRDDRFQITGHLDSTKVARFEVDTNVPTGTTQSFIFPAAGGTLLTSASLTGLVAGSASLVSVARVAKVASAGTLTQGFLADTITGFQVSLTGAVTGARSLTVPDASGTLALLSLAQTWSAAQTFSAPPVVSTGASAAVAFTVNCTGVNGANIALLGNGGTTPGKYIRATGGNLEFVSDSYAGVILTLTNGGQLRSLAGSAAAPSFAVSDAGLGLYRPALNALGVVSGGVERWRFSGVQLTGGQLVGSDSGFFSGTSAPSFQSHATNGVAAGVARWSADGQGAFLLFAKSRGVALGSYVSVIAGDELGGIFFEGADGANFKDAAGIRSYAESTYSSSVTASIRFSTHNGTSLAERLRLYADGGLQLGGGFGSSPGAGLLRVGLAGSAAACAWQLVGIGTGAFQPAANSLAFATNGVEAGRFFASGGLSVGAATDPGAGGIIASGLITGSADLSSIRTTATASIFIRASAGQIRQMVWQTGASARWTASAGSAAEAGSNAGSPWVLSAYTDGAVLIDSPISILRAAGGAITMTRQLLSATGTLALPTLAWSADPDTGFRWVSSGITGYSSNAARSIEFGSGTNAIRLFASGVQAGLNLLRDSGAAVALNDVVGAVVFGGATDAIGSLRTSAAYLRAIATETWTASATGTKLQFVVNPLGSAAEILGAQVLGDGTLASGSVAGAIGYGNADSITARLQAIGTTDPRDANVTLVRFDATVTDAPVLSLCHSLSNTLGAQVALTSGADLGLVVFDGSDGTAFRRGGAIYGTADGAWSAGATPGRLSLRTANSTGTLTEALRIDSSQRSQFANGTAALPSVTFLGSPTSGLFLAGGSLIGWTISATERGRLGLGLMIGTTTDPGAGGLSSVGGIFEQTRSVATAAATTVLDGTDRWIIATGATTHTFTLPACASRRVLCFINRSSGSITIQRAGADTINGAATSLTVTTGQMVILCGNGTDWAGRQF